MATGTVAMMFSLAPLGTAPCPGVRPGAMIRVGGTCTANFLLRGPDGSRFIGTAGHCALESQGEIVYPPGSGPRADDADGRRIGEVAYAVLEEDRDFALVRIDRGIEAKAKMCFFGGPTGVYRERSPDPVELNFYGNGTGIGNAGVINQPIVPARSGVAPDTLDRALIFAVAPANKGDSGAGVIERSTGRAMGVLVGVGTEGVWITRLAPQLAAAERALSIQLELATSQD